MFRLNILDHSRSFRICSIACRTASRSEWPRHFWKAILTLPLAFRVTRRGRRCLCRTAADEREFSGAVEAREQLFQNNTRAPRPHRGTRGSSRPPVRRPWRPDSPSRRASPSRVIAHARRKCVVTLCRRRAKIGHPRPFSSTLPPELDRPQRRRAQGASRNVIRGKWESPMRLLRTKEVATITGLSRMTIYRLERSGVFPARRKLGKNSVAWLDEDITSWIATRPSGAGDNRCAANQLELLPNA